MSENDNTEIESEQQNSKPEQRLENDTFIENETEDAVESENLEAIENLSAPNNSKSKDNTKKIFKSNDLNIDFDLEELLEILNFNNEDLENKSEEELFTEYENLIDENNCILIKNAELHENLIEYLKSIKIDESFLEDFENTEDIQKGYIEDLCSYIEFHENHHQEQSEFQKNITKLEETLKDNDEKYMNELQDFLQKLLFSGKKLSFPKNRKPLNEKLIKDNFHKIESHLKTLELARKKCNDIKISLEEKEALLKSLETLECGLTLQDYDKLESKSQHSIDKIRENKDQIDILQNKFFEKQHILVHLQEKNYYLDDLSQEKKEELDKIDTLVKEAKLDLMTLKKKKYNLKKMIENRSVKSKYLFDEELLLDYKNNTLPIQETNFLVQKNTSLKPIKSIKKENTTDEKVKIKPKFHRTANLKPSLNFDTL